MKDWREMIPKSTKTIKEPVSPVGAVPSVPTDRQLVGQALFEAACEVLVGPGLGHVKEEV